MDKEKLKKPDHVKDRLWREHVNWLDLGNKQVEENMAQRRRQQAQAERAQKRSNSD